MKVMSDFIHGFSNLDLKYIGIKEFERGTQANIEFLRESGKFEKYTLVYKV